MALKEGERFNVETMEVEKIPVVEAKKPDEKPEAEVAEVEEEEKVDEGEVVDTKSADKKEEKTDEEPEEEEEPTLSADDYIKEQFSEKYGVNSADELAETLDTLDEVMRRNEELETKLKAKVSEPEFKSESQKKLWEFIKDVDPSKMGTRMETFARLSSIDPDHDDSKILLQEQFIMKHPAWTRQEASDKFERNYKKNYTVNRDDFDTEEDYKAELKDKELDLKDDVLKAKEFLKTQKEQFKVTPEEETKPQENTALKKMIEQTSLQVDKYDFDELVFNPTDNKEDDFSLKLSKDQIKAVKGSLKAWVSNPNSYDQKGELFGGSDLEEKSTQIAFMLFGPEIVQKNYDHAFQIANIKRAEDIALKKPDRKGKVTDSKPGSNLSEEKQWEMMAARKKADRQNKSAVYK